MYGPKRPLKITLVLALAVLVGCAPTQPFYLGEDGDLSHYLQKATAVEYSDTRDPYLNEAAQAEAPITISNPEVRELWDLTLEECVHIALANTKVIRGGFTPRLQQGTIFAGTQEGSLADQPAAFSTIYNPAIRESGVGGESGTGVEAALAAFDAQLRVLGSQGNNTIFSTTDRPQNINPQNNFSGFPPALSLQNGGLISSISKRTTSGTTWTALNQTDVSAGNQRGDFQGVNSFWTTTLETRVDQPLMRGRGDQVNRMPVIIARIQTDDELAGLEDQLQKMAANIEVRYWDLSRSYRDLEVAKTARDTSLLAWRFIYPRVPGLNPVQSEAQARDQYFEFRSVVEQSLRDLHNNENELRLLMGLAVTDGRLIRPIDEPTLARVDFDWNIALAESLIRRPELRQRRWQIKRREMELILARNQLLPQFDVGAFYRWVGVGDALITSSGRDAVFPAPGSTAADSLLGGDFQEVGFSGQFLYNLGARRELAGVRNAQLNLAREKAFLEDMELDVSHGLARGIRNLDANYAFAQSHFNRWVATETEVRATQEVVEAQIGEGVANINQWLDAIRRRGRAQQAYYQAITEYNKSIADVHMRKGTILDYNGVMFEEGPWPKKAYWDALARARERDAGLYMDYGWTRPKVISRGELHNDQFPSEMEGTVEELPATEAMPVPVEGNEEVAEEATEATAAVPAQPVRLVRHREAAQGEIFWTGVGQNSTVQQAAHTEEADETE